MLFTHILALGIVALVFAWGLTRRCVYLLPLLPGPRPLPFLGNMLQLDTKRPWLTYTAWGKTYRKIIRSSILGINLIVINSEVIAQELLDRRSAKYSTRPIFRTNELYVFIQSVLHQLIMQIWTGFQYCMTVNPVTDTQHHYSWPSHTDTSIVDRNIHFLPAHTNSLRLANIFFLPRGLPFSQPFLSVSAFVDDVILGVQHEVAVEKLLFWCFGGAFSQMGRCRELSQQLLNEPFNEVKAQIVRLCRVRDINLPDLFA
ncbi:uncharacterized protein EDB93DRAFT_1083127 [Suillus bovinus]|uniref:uncharacterized protein n=1 Tax=Suillus bovinus TaxID=48563 RepID=UPI001B877640|nr:uncharacterized protein EDB93DRAFT_1083127 [Suillus bovinus]KAG2151674.1 hypothetical protein EDB93DRAFT_1083127 [Suillus bovinus]